MLKAKIGGSSTTLFFVLTDTHSFNRHQDFDMPLKELFGLSKAHLDVI